MARERLSPEGITCKVVSIVGIMRISLYVLLVESCSLGGR